MDKAIPDTATLHDAFRALREDLSREIVGQAGMIERLLIALLADGHLLVEGAPGLAKTTAIRALASRLEADFARVQFTPDLVTTDLTKTPSCPASGSYTIGALGTDPSCNVSGHTI